MTEREMVCAEGEYPSFRRGDWICVVEARFVEPPEAM
jgi:hypothetical protein